MAAGEGGSALPVQQGPQWLGCSLNTHEVALVIKLLLRVNVVVWGTTPMA